MRSAHQTKFKTLYAADMDGSERFTRYPDSSGYKVKLTVASADGKPVSIQTETGAVFLVEPWSYNDSTKMMWLMFTEYNYNCFHLETCWANEIHLKWSKDDMTSIWFKNQAGCVHASSF